jgi:hypothetical protein
MEAVAPPPTLSDRLASVINCNSRHANQIELDCAAWSNTKLGFRRQRNAVENDSHLFLSPFEFRFTPWVLSRRSAQYIRHEFPVIIDQ